MLRSSLLRWGLHLLWSSLPPACWPCTRAFKSFATSSRCNCFLGYRAALESALGLANFLLDGALRQSITEANNPVVKQQNHWWILEREAH